MGYMGAVSRVAIRSNASLWIGGVLLLSATATFGQTNASLKNPEVVSAAKVPEWQAAAGGKAEFEVASVREDPSRKFSMPPFSIDSDNDFRGSGGLFNADAPLVTYIGFAYKLSQMHPMLANLPQWARSQHFEIQARAAGNPTKDQLRLMMQSLLADRFKLAIHFEAQDTPVLVMTLLKPGKLGPRLRMHADGPACTVITPNTPGSTPTLDMFRCGLVAAVDLPDSMRLVGARNTTPEQIASFFTTIGHMRPIVDRTGIDGSIDFSMEYAVEQPDTSATGASAQASLPGATFLQAVKDQLGIKLEPGIAPLQIPVVDHVEMPSEN
jgi:bla regulator protein BlaR1